MDPNNLPGPLKVAILIKSMGADVTQRVLSTLNGNERELIKKHMAELGEISPQLVEKVAKDFTELTQKRNAKRITEKTTDRDEDTQAGASKDSGAESDGKSVLNTLDSDSLVKLIKNEYPQTIAIILANIDPGVASEVLSKLPDEIKPDKPSTYLWEYSTDRVYENVPAPPEPYETWDGKGVA